MELYCTLPRNQVRVQYKTPGGKEKKRKKEKKNPSSMSVQSCGLEVTVQDYCYISVLKKPCKTKHHHPTPTTSLLLIKKL